MAEMNHVQTDYYLKTLRESWILRRAIFLSLSSIGSATRALRALIRLDGGGGGSVRELL